MVSGGKEYAVGHTTNLKVEVRESSGTQFGQHDKSDQNCLILNFSRFNLTIWKKKE